MEFLCELIFELIAEGTFTASKSIKVPLTIRVFLIGLIIIFFVSVISLIIFTGFLMSKENLIGGVFLILMGISFAVASIVKFKKVYLSKKRL